MKKLAVFFIGLSLIFLCGSSWGLAQVDHRDFRENAQCYSCHGVQGASAPFVDENKYQNSVHGSHPCISCHKFSEAADAAATTEPRFVSSTCGSCHQQVRSQYEESFHGKAVALGSGKSPDCASCHGSHTVLSSINPAAPTSSSQVAGLCARCHPGSLPGTGSVEHYTMTGQGFGAPMYWVKKFFLWLILLVVGFFLIHIELDLFYKFRTRKS